MKELGSYLKSLREKKNMKLETAAKRTKIHINKLSAIEEGDRQALPAKVFTLGLVNSYYKELGADSQKLEDLCQQAFAEPEATPQTQPTPAKPNKQEDESPLTETQPVGWFQIPMFVGLTASLALIGVLIFLIVLVVQKMNSYSEEETLSNVVVAENTTLESPSDAMETSDSTETKEPKESSSATKDSSQKPSSAKPSPAEAKESKAITPAPSSSEEPARPSSTSDKEVVVSDNKLSLKALEPVRVEVVWSDGFVQVMLLKSQESKTLVFSTPIKVRVNNGGAIQISFNDSEAKVPGLFNQPIELKYP